MMGAPVSVSLDIVGDHIDANNEVSLTLALVNEGEETLVYERRVPPAPFGVFRLQDDETEIVASPPGETDPIPDQGFTVATSTTRENIEPGETVSETYTISHNTHGIQPGTYEFSLRETLLLPSQSTDEEKSWAFDVTGSIDLTAHEPVDGTIVHDLAVTDELSLPEAFRGQFAVDVLAPVTDTHPGMIEVTYEPHPTHWPRTFDTMGDWPFETFIGYGPAGRRLILIPAEWFAPGFVDRTESGWWQPTYLPHESLLQNSGKTIHHADEPRSRRFVVTTHPDTAAPQAGDSYTFEQGYGDDNIDVTWGFALSTRAPDGR